MPPPGLSIEDVEASLEVAEILIIFVGERGIAVSFVVITLLVAFVGWGVTVVVALVVTLVDWG